MLVLLFILVIIAFCFGVYWIAGKYIRFFGIDIKMVKWRIIRGAIAVLLTALSFVFRVFMLLILHLVALWGLCELIRVITKPLCRRLKKGESYNITKRIYQSGIVPILIIAVLFVWGYINMNNVQKTVYTVTSDKLRNDYRVVFISDTHYDTIQDNDLLEEKAAEISKLKPDIVILGGDLVEEGTSKEKMEELFCVLGDIDTKYGVYYIYGNHDRQRYSSSPSYTEQQLEDAILKNSITILKEDYVEIGDDLLLIGREDLSAKKERLSPRELLKGADKDRFILVADHQPNDVESNQSLGAQLQLSGHTHGGQIMPLGFMPFLYNGYVYGEYTAEDTTVIVSSGFAGWGFSIRTQNVSEYVVVDLIAK